MLKSNKKFITAAMLMSALITGCASTSPSERLFKAQAEPNVRTFAASAESCYIAAKRAVYGQNLRVESENQETRSFTASRYFDDGDSTDVLTMNVNVVPDGQSRSTVYASATEYKDKVHVTKERIFFVPVGSHATKVREGERTVESEEFYGRFFTTLERELSTVLKADAEAKAAVGAKAEADTKERQPIQTPVPATVEVDQGRGSVQPTTPMVATDTLAGPPTVNDEARAGAERQQ